MIRSMTGFGRAEGAAAQKLNLSVTAKSVNHRYLEVSVRLPEFLWELESPIRALASQLFSRGKLDVSVRAQRIGEVEYDVKLNRKIADTVVPQLQTLVADFGMTSSFTVSDLLRIPDLIQVEPLTGEMEESDREEILKVVRTCFERLAEMRAEEGAALRSDILARIDAVERVRADVEGMREQITRESLESYRQRVAELAAAAGAVIDQDRLAQETVLMVEKGDVAEELTRMTSHIAQIRAIVEGSEAAGKKLDFLSQELLREINTLGSKSRSANIRSLVVELKAEMERIREQVQNVE
jgi:uncharacterized protein (TIGR00255 family)